MLRQKVDIAFYLAGYVRDKTRKLGYINHYHDHISKDYKGNVIKTDWFGVEIPMNNKEILASALLIKLKERN